MNHERSMRLCPDVTVCLKLHIEDYLIKRPKKDGNNLGTEILIFLMPMSTLG